MPKFDHGDTVVIREDHPILRMKAGEVGIVVGRYDLDPPAYDVTFRDPEGKEFDALMEEDELDFPPP